MSFRELTPTREEVHTSRQVTIIPYWRPSWQELAVQADGLEPLRVTAPDADDRPRDSGSETCRSGEKGVHECPEPSHRSRVRVKRRDADKQRCEGDGKPRSAPGEGRQDGDHDLLEAVKPAHASLDGTSLPGVRRDGSIKFCFSPKHFLLNPAACEELIRRDPSDIPPGPKRLLLSKS